VCVVALMPVTVWALLPTVKQPASASEGPMCTQKKWLAAALRSYTLCSHDRETYSHTIGQLLQLC
jgi:hypothetical protein